MAFSLSDREIEELYESGEYRLNQERNDFMLPQIVDFVNTRDWINLHPEYQRRLVWDRKKKSLLIESLLMNVPIPPVFLFEYDLNRYEVMDGQQRLNTIVDFYQNRFKLSGLETWKALNGRNYDECPPRIRRGLDRRRISATILLAESQRNVSEDNDVRRTVFERLNTGGLNLHPQEMRNCLYSGPFNLLLTELAGNRLFDDIWEIPPYEDNIRGGQVNRTLRDHRLYRRMTDCEIVLRFFAFRRKSKLKGSVQRILNNCMKDYREVSVDEINNFRELFLTRLKLSFELFGTNVYRLPEKNGKSELSQPLFDAVMVALDNAYEERHALLNNRNEIRKKFTNMLRDNDTYEIIVGRPNTATAIRARQDLVRDFFNEYL
jgi:Protein of unknown function DUF262